MVGDQLCRDLPLKAELTLVGFWYPLSPPLECVAYGWVVLLQHGLQLSTGCTGCGASQEGQSKVSHACMLLGATTHKLQSDCK